MQTSMVWVLNLVDNLRKAADSIDAGRLDERLPDAGDNEIGELARSVNRLIERLQRRSEAQARFVADASHELATPVAGIRGYTSILREWGAEDPKVRDEAIDAIDRESRRMARLTADLLNLLHADQGVVLKSERFDLNTIVRERLARIASRWIDKDLEFVGPEEESLSMVGDPDRVEDVISILLDNAAKYTPAEGSVFALTERTRDTVTIAGVRHRPGHPRRRTCRASSTASSAGGIARRRRERLRSRPGHRQEHRRQHGRRDRGEQHHRAGHHVHRHAFRAAECDRWARMAPPCSSPCRARPIPYLVGSGRTRGGCVSSRSREIATSDVLIAGVAGCRDGALPSDGRDGQRNGLRGR